MNESDKELEEIRRKKLEELERKSGGKKTINKPIQVTDRTFDQVIKTHPAVAIDFWSEWCPPCRFIAPIIEVLAKDYGGKVIFGKLNVDENLAIARRHGITSIPTLLFFKDGKLAGRIIGAVPREHIERELTKIIG